MDDTIINNYNFLIEDLEQKELEFPLCIATAEHYSQMLALYIFLNDSMNAKCLWKRIPTNIKSGSSVLNKLWNVAVKILQRDTAALIGALNDEWPDNIKPIINHTQEIVRIRTFTLLSQAFSVISSKELAVNMGTNIEDAISFATSQGWIYDAFTNMLCPKQKDHQLTDSLKNDCHLHNLTNYISFLEN